MQSNSDDDFVKEEPKKPVTPKKTPVNQAQHKKAPKDTSAKDQEEERKQRDQDALALLRQEAQRVEQRHTKSPLKKQNKSAVVDPLYPDGKNHDNRL